MRHSKELISNLIQMRKDGLILTEIKSKTGLSKTTIFYHIKSIPKSRMLLDKIRQTKLEQQKAIADKRRGRSVKSYTFLRPEKWSPDFVNLVAHFMFDGQIRHTSCIYHNRSQVLLDNIISKMKSVLNISDYKTYKTTGDVKRVALHNVEATVFIKGKAQELLNIISSAPRDLKIAFLKSFFDDEGSIYFRNKGRVVRGYQHSIKILKIVKKLLEDLDIDSKIDYKFLEIKIGKRKNLLKFQELINFTPGLCVNGNRSNSIWKKDLEKREILRMALDSYIN